MRSGILATVTAAVLVVAALGFGPCLRSASAEEPISLGAFFALSGPAASIGEPTRLVAQMVVDKINKEGGVKGRQFKLETGKKHRVVIPRPRAKLNVVLKDREGEPLAGKKFELRVAGRDEPIEGSTTGDGCVDCDLPVSAKEAQLVIWLEGDKTGTRYVWDLELGALFPPETDEGVRQRLNNLGYYAGEDCGDEDDSDEDEDTGDEDDASEDEDGDVANPLSLAVAAFQEDLGLEVTGELDDDTRSKLVDAHGGT